MVQVSRFLPIVVLTTCFALPTYAAHTHVQTPSTWELDASKSDFGGGPAMKSDVMHITVDTERALKYTDVMVDANGKTWKTSWSGPQDGTMKPLTGMPGGQASFNAAEDSSRMQMPDGSKMDCTLSLSDDKKQSTEKCTVTTKDGKTANQTLVYNRTK